MVEVLAEWASLPLRIIIGLIFLYSGFPKLKNFGDTVKTVKNWGFVPPGIFAFGLAFSEFFGGLAVLVGFHIRIAAVLLMVTMLVALYMQKFKWNKGFRDYSKNLIIIAALISLFFLGSGNWSFDQMLGWIWG